MIKRILIRQLSARLKQFPAVALLGLRQSGKTTLAKTLSRHYFDLEQSEDQLNLDCAMGFPDPFWRMYHPGRGAIDAKRKQNGCFLLLGSVAPGLMKNVSESLAGRLAICELYPLFLTELGKKYDEDEMWLRGGFPDGGILKKKNFPVWERDYLALLAQRNLPS